MFRLSWYYTVYLKTSGYLLFRPLILIALNHFVGFSHNVVFLRFEGVWAVEIPFCLDIKLRALKWVNFCFKCRNLLLITPSCKSFRVVYLDNPSFLYSIISIT